MSGRMGINFLVLTDIIHFAEIKRWYARRHPEVYRDALHVHGVSR